MKIEKLPSGSYRVRKTIDKKTYSLVFDHKPTQNEITEEFYRQYRVGGSRGKKSVKDCALEYIQNRSNISSPTTLRGYRTFSRSLSPAFANKDIYKLEQSDIQAEINLYKANHAPKTVYNYHGFISAIVKVYRPDMIVKTSLPRKKKFKHYIPTEEDVKRILEASVNDKYHIAFQLGVMGLRRGEVAGINIDTDMSKTTLWIHQVMCETDTGEGWIIKDIPKTDSSNREIPLPQKLIDEINAQGYIIDTTPPMILNRLHKYQRKLDIPQFRFHDLRTYFASYCHSLNIPDVYITEMGGWKNIETVNQHYKSAMEDRNLDFKKTMADKLLS